MTDLKKKRSRWWLVVIPVLIGQFWWIETHPEPFPSLSLPRFTRGIFPQDTLPILELEVELSYRNGQQVVIGEKELFSQIHRSQWGKVRQTLIGAARSTNTDRLENSLRSLLQSGGTTTSEIQTLTVRALKKQFLFLDPVHPVRKETINEIKLELHQ